MVSARCFAFQITTLGLLWLAVTTTHAQTSQPDAYQKAIETAVLEFHAGNWPEARALFEQAHALRPNARTLRGMGKVSFELKEYVRAQRELSASLVELRSPLPSAQRQEVVALLVRVEQFIGRLEIHVQPEGIEPNITLDGSRVQGELKLDLGQHQLSVQAPGYRSLTRTVSIDGGKTLRLELALTPVESTSSGTGTLTSPPDLSPQAAVNEGTAPVLDSPDKYAARGPSDAGRPRKGLLQRWWFWTIVGAVAVGGVVTAIALTTPTTPEPPVRGNTGVTVEALIRNH